MGLRDNLIKFAELEFENDGDATQFKKKLSFISVLSEEPITEDDRDRAKKLIAKYNWKV
jgi:hypothetical protein